MWENSSYLSGQKFHPNNAIGEKSIVILFIIYIYINNIIWYIIILCLYISISLLYDKTNNLFYNNIITNNYMNNVNI